LSSYAAFVGKTAISNAGQKTVNRKDLLFLIYGSLFSPGAIKGKPTTL
jgi:hypothetical protein